MNTRRKQRIRKKSSLAGFTLVEALISLFVVSMMVALVVALGSIRTGNKQSTLRAKAATLADEEISALRRLDFSTLTNVVNVGFMNILHNAGTWAIGTDSTSPGTHSISNVVETPLVGGFAPANISARLLLPAGSYADSQLQAAWKVAADSPNTWSVGFLMRSRDVNNSYRLRIAQNDGTYQQDLDASTGGTQNIYLEKIVAGTASKLGAANVTLSKDSWFTATVTVTGSALSVSLNGGAAVISASDSTYPSGPSALVTWNGAHVYVDDVKTVTPASCGTSTCWDFQGGSTLPAAWIRLGINDLADTTPTTHDDNGRITITSYPDAGSVTLKKAVVTVTWTERGTTRTYTASTLLGLSTIGR